MRNNKRVEAYHIGYLIKGIAELNLWGGEEGWVDMDTKIIHTDHFNKTNLLKAINDAQFGCESIKSAKVEIYDLYDYGINFYNRTIEVTSDIHMNIVNNRSHGI